MYFNISPGRYMPEYIDGWAEAESMPAVSAKRIFKRDQLVIVDRQPIVLLGLRSILGAQQDFDVVASCRDGTSCLEAIRNLTPDVALVADTLPDLTVSEILAIAKAENLPTRLVFFTEAESNHDLTAAVAAGACSAISKCESPDSMLRLLRLLTKRSISPAHFGLSPAGKEADGAGKIEESLEQKLTHRERQIARLVSEGMSNKEIARQLNVSPGTVSVHLHNIFQKLEITNRTVLASLALLKHPSGFGTLALAFLVADIADELKASQANDIFPNDDSIGHAGEQAGHEPWKKAILQHLSIWGSGETPPLSQRDFLAKLGQVPSTAAAMEALRVGEQSAGSKPWKNYGPVGSSTPNVPAPLLRGTGQTQIGGDLTAEHQFPWLASNPMSIQSGYGTFATLAGALIYALYDPHLAVQSHDLGQASIDSFVAVAEENAATKLTAITLADANHVHKPAPGLPSHDSRPSSANATTGNENAAGEDAQRQVSHDAEGDTLQKPVGLADAGPDASVGVYSRDQLMGGGNVDGNVVHRSPTDPNSTSCHSAFDFGSGSSRINLAAFGALAWLHMTAASKSIPPHTLAWIYDVASNETVVYVNPTDRVLDIGDRGLLEIHLQGIVSVAEPDLFDHREGAAVTITLEKLEEALTSASALDETVLSKDIVQASIEASESTPGTAGAWAILLDDGLRFQFGPTRTDLGGTTRFRTFTGDGSSGESVRVSSIEPAHSATAAAVGNLTLTSGPTNADTGDSSTGLNAIVQPSVATAANADHGNSQRASESGAAKAAATESTEAGSKPGNGVGNGAEHNAPVSNAAGASAAVKTADPAAVEHGNSLHSTATNIPEAVEIVDPGVATGGNAERGNSQHASESGAAKAAATESTEAGSKPGNGGNGAEHNAPVSIAAGASAAVKTADPAAVEHGNSLHSTATNIPEAVEIVDPGVATGGNAERGNSQHASESGAAKAAATESTEAGSKPGNGVGNGAEHNAPVSNAAGASAAVKTADPAAVEHGNSLHSTATNTPEAVEIVDPGVATGGNAERGNSQHASESGAAKAAATESTEAGSKPGNGVGNGAEHNAPVSNAAGASAAVKTADPAAVEHGNSLHSTATNTPEAVEIVDPGVATGGNAERGNSQHAAQSAAIASEDAQPAKAASETGGADQEPVFRFDSETVPSTLVAVVELKELNDARDPHVPLGQKEFLDMLGQMVPNAPDEHAANHGNNGPHHGIVLAPHDLLI
ncbi:LuxR C-terminal-related transcriptional regulator [Bradyrhizobium diazoefficiens]|uniref:LuxR C-terminal-related transcriptional regulator n=1 Tax=Bradyrhizobium diazoefficiens TaxID=1355477 RepID=UPI001B52D6BB|nr:DNA-binding NarL/FixJ family response regulator [Bradyrhizobium japonicum]